MKIRAFEKKLQRMIGDVISCKTVLYKLRHCIFYHSEQYVIPTQEESHKKLHYLETYPPEIMLFRFY